ncbi:MAG: penicillin-binding transpeptidase domain-containing protein [Anaerovoracaceae bacterium]
MKKIEKRAIMCLLIAAVLVLGVGLFSYRYVADGKDWAMFSGNKTVHTNGKLDRGSVYDINGKKILNNAGGKMDFSDNLSTRKALVHLSGDKAGNITTGANNIFADKLMGYNLISGTYSANDKGRKVNLTVDADVCTTANNALYGRSGTVGVYNYKTGEIICAVSSPNYDPSNPPTISSDDKSGIYMNRLFSARFSPGSIFKLVTAAASIETKSDYSSWKYNCTGRLSFNSADRVTCPSAHGTVDLEEALAVSCNCYFGQLSQELGPKVLKKYTKKTGLTTSRDINGISTAKGKFAFPDSGINLAWAGIGQHNDLLNPSTMMIYMGAIANGGKAVLPKIIHNTTFDNGIPASFSLIKKKSKQMIEETTATTLQKMMRNNVEENYGTDNFPGLNICAKSGTAEVGGNKAPNSWFSGFINDENNPYAFIVLVENGGSGKSVAGSIANTVLQEVVD